MNVVSSDCIILKNRDFKERDRMVTFLTSDKGKLTGIARGAQNPTGRGVGVYEPCTRGTIYYVEKAGSDLVSIRKCDPIPPYLMLEGTYESMLYAGYAVEWIALTPIGADEAMAFYELLGSTLIAVAQDATPFNLAQTRLAFDLDFVTLQGFQPDWRRCCACGRAIFQPPATPGGQGTPSLPRLVTAGEHCFDIKEGGVCCPDCCRAKGPHPMLSAGTMMYLMALLSRPRDQPALSINVKPTHHALAQLERVLALHLQHRMERIPRSLSMLPSISKSQNRADGAIDGGATDGGA